jgi:hypothetical protein
MSSGTLAIVIVVIVVVIAAVVVMTMVARRRRLQQQFGPEYDRTVEEKNSRLKAEAELSERQRRVRKLDIKPLSEDARERYTASWMTIQEQFVDAPQAATSDAYELVTQVMQERGYPTDDDEQVMADLSVEHAQTVGSFRSARALTMNVVGGDAATEDLRQALIQYRELFGDLLGTTALGNGQPVTEPDEPVSAVTDAPEAAAAAPSDAAGPGDDLPAGSTGTDYAPDYAAGDAAPQLRADEAEVRQR